jgi:hypothetical protein
VTPWRAIQLALCAGAAVAAVALVRRDARHKPVVWYLVAVFGLDLLRLGLHQLLPSGPAVRQGSVVVLRHADQAVYVALLMAVPAMAVRLFLRRRPWMIAAAGLVLWLAIVVSYPGLRGDVLLELYSVVELAGALLAVGCFVTWAKSPQAEEGSAPIQSGIILAGASLATVIVPSLFGALSLERWDAIMALHALAFAAVLVLQLRSLLGDPKQENTT